MPEPVREPGAAAQELLVDVGSTVIKACTRRDGGFSPVVRFPRDPTVLPGVQVRELIDRGSLGAGTAGSVRVCSSANGGIRAGVLGLSQRHSVAAAVRAVADGGGNVAYARTFGAPVAGPAPHVDVLVLVGGVDDTDPGRMRAALGRVRLADHPHDALVWAGADVPGLLADRPVHRRVGNVIDEHLRPRLGELSRAVREHHLDDLVDRRGLGALDGLTAVPIWPTPAVVGLEVARRAARPEAGTPPAPFVVVDVGGATTDVFVCAELHGPHVYGDAAGPSVVRHVFPDLGVAGSGSALRRRLRASADLFDAVAAVAPGRSRALYTALVDGEPDALAAPAGFLACLFLALRRVAAPGGRQAADLARAAGILVTGGAWTRADEDDVRRVLVATGCPSPGPAVVVDREYLLWARGLAAVPPVGEPDL